MATSKQIRAYAKEHNISNAEAKQHFIDDATKNTIQPFIIRGEIVSNQVVYDTSALYDNQAGFVEGCVKTLNDMIIDENKTLDPADTLTCVMYNSKEDFAGHLSQGHKGSLDDAWAELKMVFDKHHTKGLQVGFSYTREEMVEMGTEMAGQCMDMLNEDGVWTWPNANATFQKKGDKMIVMEVA
jgi:hypothetical protein